MSSAQPLWLWLALRIALAGMLPLVVVAALILVILLPQLRADLEISHQILARAIAGQIEVHLLGAGRELQAIAEDIRNQSHQPVPFWLGSLDAHAGTGDVFSAIYITDSNDLVYAVGLPQAQRARRDDLLGLDLSRWDVLREAQEQNESVWSETFLSIVTGRLAVTLAIPMGERTLMGEIAIDQLSEFMDRLPDQLGILTMVLDRQGQIIAHSQGALSGQQINFSHLPIVRDALQGRFATHSFALNSQIFIGTPVSISQLSWIVLVAQPRMQAFQSFLSALWVVGAGATIALMLVIVISLLLTHDFARRISCYTAQAHAIADADYDQPESISNIREFDGLASALERMSLAISQRERDLTISETRFRDLSTLASDWFWEQDAQFRFRFFSEGVMTSALESLGVGYAELLGKTRWELPISFTPEQWAAHRALLEAHQPFRDLEYRVCPESGVDRWFSISGQPLFDDSGCFLGYRGTGRDITERKQAEETLRRANRQLRMLSDCNQALIRITDEIELLITICTIVVQAGGYRMAWVGYAEHDKFKTVRPVAHAGFESGYLKSIKVSWADTERGRGPIGTAIRTGHHCLIQSITHSRLASQRGYAAVCALPLTFDDQIFGALGIYSSAPDAFDVEEIALLRELASDLAFGIAMLRTRAERERAEKALQLAQLSILRSADAMFWVRSDGYFINVNEQACHTLGYTHDELLTMAVWDIDPDFTSERWSPHWERTRHLKKRRFETRHQRKDGVIFPVEVTANHVEYEGQEYDFAFVRDITERKRTEEALSENERKYRELVENANSIILRWNPQGEITFMNEYGLKFFGYSEAELFGRLVKETIVPPDESTGRDLRPLMDEICHHPERFKYNINENIRRDGERVWIAWTNKAVLDERSQVVEVFSVGSDITDRKRAEEALRESEERFAKAFRANPASMVISVIETGCFIDVNEQWLMMLGYTREETIGHTSTELGIWADSGSRQQMIAQLRRDGFFREAPIRFRTKTGDILDVLWSAETIRFGDQEVMLSLIYDITERKRVEEELQRHREHLEELVTERTAELHQAMDQLVQSEKLAALGQLVAGVAHELNTPLGNTRTVASTLAEHLRVFAAAIESGALRRSQVDSFLSRGQEAVDLLERNTARAADLIEHFKQVAVDQTSMRRRRFNLRQTIEEMLVTLRPQFKHTAHRVELDIAPELELDSYPGPLEQVIANLVGNSLTHGFVGMETGIIRMHAAALGPAQVVLRYTDDGLGIPPTILNHIFEPFFTTRLGQGGSGLGLYIVYNLVTSVLGGAVKVESLPGQGAGFTFVLPRDAPVR
ncbi:MAG: PAS domain S-box protein [Gammaproteobacteria bacterium]|nr:PAS domain S-box protein [Gammaproteobacteria bacterium]